jgi:hypothetical protein
MVEDLTKQNSNTTISDEDPNSSDSHSDETDASTHSDHYVEAHQDETASTGTGYHASNSSISASTSSDISCELDSSDDSTSDTSSDTSDTFSDRLSELEIEMEELQNLFPGSKISSHDCAIALLSIAHKHSLTYSAVTDILKLLSVSLPSPSFLPASHHGLFKSYVNYKEETVVHRCCGYCTNLLSQSSSCTVGECQDANIPDASFVEIRLDHQLRTLFSGNVRF